MGKKRILALLMALIMVLGLCACGNKKKEDKVQKIELRELQDASLKTAASGENEDYFVADATVLTIDCTGDYATLGVSGGTDNQTILDHWLKDAKLDGSKSIEVSGADKKVYTGTYQSNGSIDWTGKGTGSSGKDKDKDKDKDPTPTPKPTKAPENPDEPDEPTVTEKPEPEKPATFSGDVTIDKQVVFDQDGFTATVTGLEEGWSGYELGLSVKNDSDKNLTFYVQEMAINDYMIKSLCSCPVTSGNSAVDEISILSDPEEWGGGPIAKIELWLRVYETETFDNIFDDVLYEIKTSAYDYYDPSSAVSGTELYNDNGLKIVMTGSSTDSRYSGDYTIVDFYLENSSDITLTINTRDRTSINGIMIDDYLYGSLKPGKKVIEKMEIDMGDLSEKGISSIDEIEMIFHVVDSDTYDAIVDTDPVSFEI